MSDQNDFSQLIENMKDMLYNSELEYKEYIDGGRQDKNLLQQAGEKLWCSLNNYIDVYKHEKNGTARERRKLIQHDILFYLMEKCQLLHVYFYTANDATTDERAEELYIECVSKLKSRIERTKQW